MSAPTGHTTGVTDLLVVGRVSVPGHEKSWLPVRPPTSLFCRRGFDDMYFLRHLRPKQHQANFKVRLFLTTVLSENPLRVELPFRADGLMEPSKVTIIKCYMLR